MKYRLNNIGNNVKRRILPYVLTSSLGLTGCVAGNYNLRTAEDVSAQTANMEYCLKLGRGHNLTDKLLMDFAEQECMGQNKAAVVARVAGVGIAAIIAGLAIKGGVDNVKGVDSGSRTLTPSAAAGKASSLGSNVTQ